MAHLPENSLNDYAGISKADIDFARAPVIRYSSGGVPFTVWAPLGMPRIDDRLLDCVFYLYPTRKAAKDGAHMGGTGFIVGIRSETIEGTSYGYAITNRHVAVDDGFSVVRINKRDGGTEIYEFDPAEWFVHPDYDDLAAVPFGGSLQDEHNARFLDADLIVTETAAEAANIGPGDEVIMLGRFVHHDGKERNDPSVRFGNISMQPRPIVQSERNNFPQLSYAVELRSMGGYSGSPVLVYRGPFDASIETLGLGNPYFALLGVNWGHITDVWEVQEGYVKARQEGTAPRRKINYVRANTGMNGVIPAWKILELINLPEFVEHRKMQDKAAAENETPRGGVALDSAKSAPPTKGNNPQHEADFNRLLGAAVQTPKSDD